MPSARRGSRRRGRRGSEALAEPADAGPAVVSELCQLGPFAVFCALHLGITERNGFAPQEPTAVARRFQLSTEELELYLREHAIAPDDLAAAGFDREAARFDMQVAPAGISRVELARTLYQELRQARADPPASAGRSPRRTTGR